MQIHKTSDSLCFYFQRLQQSDAWSRETVLLMDFCAGCDMISRLHYKYSHLSLTVCVTETSVNHISFDTFEAIERMKLTDRWEYGIYCIYKGVTSATRAGTVSETSSTCAWSLTMHPGCRKTDRQYNSFTVIHCTKHAGTPDDRWSPLPHRGNYVRLKMERTWDESSSTSGL